jgi:hypothetical protein
MHEKKNETLYSNRNRMKRSMKHIKCEYDAQYLIQYPTLIPIFKKANIILGDDWNRVRVYVHAQLAVDAESHYYVYSLLYILITISLQSNLRYPPNERTTLVRCGRIALLFCLAGMVGVAIPGRPLMIRGSWTWIIIDGPASSARATHPTRGAGEWMNNNCYYWIWSLFGPLDE